MRIVDELEACRVAERHQAAFYRALAAQAEAAGSAEIAARLHDLHADEQHHLARLTARLLELGHEPAPLPEPACLAATLAGWESDAAARERAELERYTALLRLPLDPATAALVRAIAETERHHLNELGGKWTPAA
jgi:rubrerythrin